MYVEVMNVPVIKNYTMYTSVIVNINYKQIIMSLLTARPWAERGSCFTRDLLLLTARPWAERGSCSAWDLLLFFVVFFLSVTRRKPPLGQIVIGALKSRNL